MQQIYQTTKTKVERILNELDGKVERAFDAGAKKAKQLFEDYVDSIIDAVAAIAKRALAGAAKLVETALAKSIPLIIGLLAAFK